MAEIRHRESTWSVWTHGCPNGEQVDQVQRRSEQTIDRMLMIPKPGDIALFAHGHSLRGPGRQLAGRAPLEGDCSSWGLE